MTRRVVLQGAVAGLAAVGSSGCATRRVLARGQRELTVWHSWGGAMAPKFAKVCAAFERSHPGIRLRLVYTRNNLATNQKFFTAVAAGAPPDVTAVDGPQVASWAQSQAIAPLDDRLAASGIKPDDYFPPTWRQNFYEGKVWALTYCADPNFGFAWNRQAFRAAGLDSDRPPQTIDELTEYVHRTTVLEGGVIRRIGLLPWGQYGSANSIFTWGWAFGGEFYKGAERRITADHPRVVKALEWMVSFAKEYDPARIASMTAGLDSAEQNPFYSGRLAMQCLHVGGLVDIFRFAPDLDFGLGYIPAPGDGEPHSSWVGGWCMAIPKGCRNPDLAWEWIRWLCHDPEGTMAVGKEAGLFPGMRYSPYYERARRERYYGDYVRILEESRHQRPVMPVQAFYMRELQRAVDAAVYGRKSPAEALADARKNTQAELDLVLAGA